MFILCTYFKGRHTVRTMMLAVVNSSEDSDSKTPFGLWTETCFCITKLLYYNGSRGSSGSIVSDYGLDDRAIGVRSPAWAKDFSSLLCVQTGSGAHPASCTLGTGGPFPGGKSAAGA
jgi:hypothetical protein